MTPFFLYITPFQLGFYYWIFLDACKSPFYSLTHKTLPSGSYCMLRRLSYSMLRIFRSVEPRRTWLSSFSFVKLSYTLKLIFFSMVGIFDFDYRHFIYFFLCDLSIHNPLSQNLPKVVINVMWIDSIKIENLSSLD